MNGSDNMKGAALMVASMCAFAINDALLKTLGGSMPVFQTLFVRTSIVLVLLGSLVTLSRKWRVTGLTRNDKIFMWARAAVEVGAAYFIVNALFNMKLANVTAILQMLPLTVTLAAHLFFGEALGWRRMLAIGVGFCGMILIVQPAGDAFNAFSVYALGGVVCVTARDMLARRLGGKVSAYLMSFQAALLVFLFAALASTWETWGPVPSQAWGALLGSSVAITIGYIVSVQVMRHGDIGFTAQFRYTGLVAALILGYLMFDEWPNALTMIGAGVVVGTGLFMLSRERRLARTAPAVDSAPDSP